MKDIAERNKMTAAHDPFPLDGGCDHAPAGFRLTDIACHIGDSLTGRIYLRRGLRQLIFTPAVEHDFGAGGMETARGIRT